jgi:hypothetical protein
MNRTLLDRLDAVGRSLATRGDALALIGLGSVGLDCERSDERSDLDFFAIVEPGRKARYINSLVWLVLIQVPPLPLPPMAAAKLSQWARAPAAGLARRSCRSTRA